MQIRIGVAFWELLRQNMSRKDVIYSQWVDLFSSNNAKSTLEQITFQTEKAKSKSFQPLGLYMDSYIQTDTYTDTHYKFITHP